MVNSLIYNSFDSIPKDVFQIVVAYTCAKDLIAYGTLCRLNKKIRALVEQVFDHSWCGYASLISACRKGELLLLKKWIILPSIEQKLKKQDETVIAALQLGLLVAIKSNHAAITQFLIEEVNLNPTLTFNPLDKAKELNHLNTHHFLKGILSSFFLSYEEDLNDSIKNRLINKIDFVFDLAIKYNHLQIMEVLLIGKQKILARQIWIRKFIERVLEIQKTHPTYIERFNCESLKIKFNVIFKQLLPHLKEYQIDSKTIVNRVMEKEAIVLIEIFLSHVAYDSDIDYDAILNWAIIRNLKTIVKKVLEKITFEPSIRNSKALYLAVINNRELIVEELLKHQRVDANPFSVYQAIRWAHISDRKNMIKKLLELPGVDPRACKALIPKKMYVKVLLKKKFKEFLKKI